MFKIDGIMWLNVIKNDFCYMVVTMVGVIIVHFPKKNPLNLCIFSAQHEQVLRFFRQGSPRGPFPWVCYGTLLFLHSTCDTCPILETLFTRTTCIANMPSGATRVSDGFSTCNPPPLRVPDWAELLW
jgi:hypothetical protein